jgi:hypothetical protein
MDFIIDLNTNYGIQLEAISWHENGGTSYDTRPDGIPTRANYLRQQLQTHLPGYNPEFHVNEFMGKQVHLSPGWNVGFLYYLEKAQINKYMRACWWIYSTDPTEYWCDCWAGLNGLLMNDGETPQPAYWVWKQLAQMQNETKITTISTEKYTNLIATRNQTTNIINLLLGRYLKNNPNHITINLQDYKYTHKKIRIQIQKIPHFPEFYDDPPKAIPLPNGPIQISDTIIPIIENETQITITNCQDGEAYIITIYPIPNKPPTPPYINGPSHGQKGQSYDYTFSSYDSNDDQIYYYIDWGDNTNQDWIGPYPSNYTLTLSHTWQKKGTYTIKSKSKDTKGLESSWSEKSIQMPHFAKTKPQLLQNTITNYRYILLNFSNKGF